VRKCTRVGPRSRVLNPGLACEIPTDLTFNSLSGGDAGTEPAATGSTLLGMLRRFARAMATTVFVVVVSGAVLWLTGTDWERLGWAVGIAAAMHFVAFMLLASNPADPISEPSDPIQPYE
jgi:hypothetical protein